MVKGGVPKGRPKLSESATVTDLVPKKGRPRSIGNETVNALKFVKLAQKEESDDVFKTHCRFENNTLSAFDGKLAAGLTIETDLPPLCAHTYKLLLAMQGVGARHELTYIDEQLIISDGKFRAVVPTIDSSVFEVVQPDPAMYPINDDWKNAAIKACAFVNENASEVVSASIMTLPDQSFVGTNRNVMVQVAHYTKFPPFLVIPKLFVTALAKIRKSLHLQRFGFSDTSLTIWFDDGSWFKTQLYSDGYPKEDTQKILDELNPAIPVDIPAGFFDGVEHVADFSEDKWIYSEEGKLRSHPLNDDRATTFKCSGIPAGLKLNAAYMKTLLALDVKSVDWDTDRERFYGNFYVFYGPSLRVAVVRNDD